jgi:nickel transport protein
MPIRLHMHPPLWLTLTALLFVPAAGARAHGVDKSISRDEAVVVELAHDDGEAFSFERYEIFREGEETPYQSGLTDAHGRIVFLPDRRGSWRVRAFSEDGHGVDFTFDAGDPDEAGGGAAVRQVGSSDRILRVAVGVLLILCGFLLVGYLRAGKRTPGD